LKKKKNKQAKREERSEKISLLFFARFYTKNYKKRMTESF